MVATHLATIEPLLPQRQRSRLLPLRRLAGWLTGALPALVGPQAVYATIQAVETFVDHHCAEQIEAIDRQDLESLNPPSQSLRALLETCRADEVAHRDEAAALFAMAAQPSSAAMRVWLWSVGGGSRAAVKICRWVRAMAPNNPPALAASTVRNDGVARFDRLAATWWNTEGPMRPLHVINTLRLGDVL